ncbi:MAG: hypothetical protein RLY93_20800 [Sumerlaeia bacterium]
MLWVVLPLFVFGAMAFITRGDFLDDAYISFRYARHIQEGHGIVWSIGEAPIEGFTNFLTTIGSSVLFRLGFSPVGAGYFFAAVGTLLLFVFFGGLARLLNLGLLGGLAGILVCAANPHLAGNFSNGLETLLAAGLSAGILAIAVAIVLQGASLGRIAAFCALGFVGGLTRPDMLILASMTFLPVFFSSWQESWKRWLAVIGAFSLLGITFLGWKLATFGSVLPLPFHVKQGGLGINADTALSVVMLVLRFFPLAALSLFFVDWKEPAQRLAYLTVAIPAAIFAAYHSTVADPVMGENYRFFAPIFPHLTVLGLFFIRALPFGPAWRGRVFVALLIPAFIIPASYFRDARATRQTRENTRYFDIARAIAGHSTRPGVLATGEAGVIPYVTDWPHIDLNRLNHPILAREPERDIEVIFGDGEPDLVFPMTDRRHFEKHYLKEELTQRGYLYLGTVTVGTGQMLLLYVHPKKAERTVVEALRGVVDGARD